MDGYSERNVRGFVRVYSLQGRWHYIAKVDGVTVAHGSTSAHLNTAVKLATTMWSAFQ